MSGERTIHLDQQPRKWPLTIMVILLIITVAYLTIETMRLKQRVATIASQQLDAEDLNFLTNDLPGIITNQVQQSMRTDDESVAPEVVVVEEAAAAAPPPQQEQPPLVAEVVVKGGGGKAAAARRRSSRSKKDDVVVEEVVMTS